MWDAHHPHFTEYIFKSLISYSSQSKGNEKDLISHTVSFLDITVQNAEYFSCSWEAIRLMFFLLVSKAFQKYLFLSWQRDIGRKWYREHNIYYTWDLMKKTWARNDRSCSNVFYFHRDIHLGLSVRETRGCLWEGRKIWRP